MPAWLAGEGRLSSHVQGELASGDLGGWPPEGVVGAVLGRTLAEEGRVALGQQHALEDPKVGLRFDRGASSRRDRLGGGVGLLAGEPALLDAMVGGVAGGVYVGRTGHAAVPIDRQESIGVVGEPR